MRLFLVGIIVFLTLEAESLASKYRIVISCGGNSRRISLALSLFQSLAHLNS